MLTDKSAWSTGLVALAAALVLMSVPLAGAERGNDENGYVEPGLETDIVGDGWVRFSWWGSTVFGQPWEYTSESPTTLRVTDAFCYGDVFRVYDNEQELGDTSDPGSSACGGPGDGDAAYEDPDMSSGCWLLLPGSHSITLDVIQNPFGSGGAWLRADPVTDYVGPECLPLPL